jgi:hypothetical protein
MVVLPQRPAIQEADLVEQAFEMDQVTHEGVGTAETIHPACKLLSASEKIPGREFLGGYPAAGSPTL